MDSLDAIKNRRNRGLKIGDSVIAGKNKRKGVIEGFPSSDVHSGNKKSVLVMIQGGDKDGDRMMFDFEDVEMIK